MFPYHRLNKIFNYINKNNFTEISDLCKYLNVSDRTIRTDIQTINKTLLENGATIKLKRKYGYYIDITDQNKFNTFLENLSNTEKSNIDLDSTKDRMKYMLNILLYQNNYIPLDTLADMIFVTTNTLKNYIKSLNEIFPKYNLEFITKPNLGVKVIGNEDDKRKFLMDILLYDNFQNYVTSFSKDEYMLFKDIDLDKLKDIIYKNFKNANIKINDYNFKNLVIHFALMISRIKNDSYINNNFNIKINDNLKTFIEDISAQLEQEFDITISDGEKHYMYVHIVSNSHIDGIIDDDEKIRKIVSDLLNTIYTDYNFDLRTDEILLNDLFVHFKSILNKKYLDLNKRNPLLNTIKSNFPLAFDMAFSSVTKIFKNLPYVLTEDEIGYISLHIGAALERCFSGSIKIKNVILICASGQATSRMVEARLNVFFKDKINIVSRMSYNDFLNYSKKNLINIDFIISTIPISFDDIPTINIDFTLQKEDIEKISKLLTHISSNKTKNSINFFDENLFIHINKNISKNELLEEMFSKMKANNIIDDEYVLSVLERENLSKTNMNDVFALPHPIKLCAKQTKVAVAILDSPVLWDKHSSVQIVFLLAIKQGEQQNIEHLYDIFIEIVNNTNLQQQIIQCKNYSDFIEVLYNNIN